MSSPRCPDRVLRRGFLVPLRGAGVVHSAYRRTTNLAVGRGARPPFLVTLAAGELPDGPTVVRLGAPPPALAPGTPFLLDGATLRCGPVVADLATAPVWRPRRPRGRCGDRPSVVALADRARREALGRAAPVVRGWAEGPSLPAAAWPSHLLGAGPGLTPAGDDALVGALLALHALGERVAVAALAAAVRADLRRTTDVSAHLLRLATSGHAAAPLHTLLQVLLAGDDGEQDLAQALADTLAVGATSGADAVVGLTTTLLASLPATRGPAHRHHPHPERIAA